MLNDDDRRRSKEQAIYDAVLSLIARGEDPGALRVQQIAQAAEMGKGTVYEYFPSKEAILRGLKLHCMESELARLEAAAGPCRTLEELLDALLAYLTDLARDRAGIYRIIAASLGRNDAPDACRLDPALGTRLQALLHATMARLRDAGEIDDALGEEYCLYALSAAGVSCLVLLTAADAHGMPAPAVLEYTRLLLRRALCPPTGQQ